MVDRSAAARMRLRMWVHYVSGTARLQRVVMTAAPLRRTHITRVLWQHTGALTSSRADLLRLGALFRLAAVSPHSAVFLPLRANPVDEWVAAWADSHGLADLVIVRRDVHLRPSIWPSVRARLGCGAGRGRLSTMLTPAARPPVDNRNWDWMRQRLSVAEHGDTMVLSGWPEALYYAGDELTRCGNEVAVNREIRRYGGLALLGQFNGPGRRAGRRDASWGCMVLAVDEIFHRNR
ncbi:hypothetical protein [Dactylosporangium sp. CA-139066]|uniref:hypothetical protein n=1 Tax=Dactylosporangium sp. CA-139066 TaxID=3239930 RepID=UPI003D8ED0CA